ncbi:hypothetical protein UY3_17306 [Chelonia mydas]|uniref:Uncharacterized protein n=1 Tax=Chelonia mydas TaxID=8469 RepID=M7AKD2_CHEMY|nr:hypothetical protein UY3_17306 [Chelonia mydas]
MTENHVFHTSECSASFNAKPFCVSIGPAPSENQLDAKVTYFPSSESCKTWINDPQRCLQCCRNHVGPGYERHKVLSTSTYYFRL